MSQIPNYQEKIELSPQEWLCWQDEKFNRWRSVNDFPRVVEFLSDSLPFFNDWLTEQVNIKHADLIEFGPARFIKRYGFDVSLVQIDVRYNPFGDVPNDPIIHTSFLSRHELEGYEYRKCIRSSSFISYTDWAIKNKIIDYKCVLETLIPNGSVAYDKTGETSYSNIQFNIPLHMIGRSVQYYKENRFNHETHKHPPKLELLKLGGFSGEIDGGSFGEKNLEFSDLSNLKLNDVMIPSLQSFYYCKMTNFNLIKSNLHMASFYQSVVGIDIREGSIAECNFEYGKVSLSICDGNLSKSKIKSSSLSIDLDKADIIDTKLAYDELVNEPKPERSRIFHRNAKLLYSRLGYPDLAGEHYFMEEKSKRQNLWTIFNGTVKNKGLVEIFSSFFKSSGMLLQELYWGYGEKPLNIIKSVAVIIFLFAMFLFLSDNSSTHLEFYHSIIFSIQSFTNIEIVDITQDNLVINLASSVLSFFGLVSIGLLIASLAAKAKNYN
ncbi:hypothetical protein RN22_00625 [Grimontia sp. AD028]|uniref:hypothetical protein n=1 Tax=Grimontia sp. AD028 TaxID=1581149 RepID=UPI00061B4653|nr:hypothetical protein [Grimontia sp. AD028]KKD62475.1 hypothetical protein RN22_00625 [Grimontia sp. AD028]